MCWTSKIQLRIKVAEEDILVKKIIYTNGDSFFYGFNYKVDPIIHVPLVPNKDPDFHWVIHRGYHSYSDKCKIIKIENSLEQRYLVYWKNTFLSVYSEGNTYDSIKIQNFIIPKGTKYCENEFGEIVSELIKMV